MSLPIPSYLRNLFHRHAQAAPISCKSWSYAKQNIKCECSLCGCPGAGQRNYSFRYVDEIRACIYFDVPKAASSTIRKKLGVGQLPHETSLIDPQMPFERYFKFSIVRNPWDRMVSNWKMFTTKPGRMRQLESMTDQDLRKFEDFVSFALKTPNHHWQPQSLYVPDQLDYLGKMENFPEVMSDLAKIVPNFDGENIVVNGTVSKSSPREALGYREHYSDKIMDDVSNFYAEDIERFAYHF